MKDDKALRDELRAKHGDECVTYDNAKHGLFVFRKPTAVAYARFRSAVTKKGADSTASVAQLCTDCLVYPVGDSGPDYDKCLALFEAYPALSDSLSGALVKLAGGGDPEENGLGKL